MKKQTAVQAFIEWAISLKDREQQCIDWIVIKNKAEELLPMEKEQIENAYRINPNNEIWSNSGIDYYNKTYGGDK